MIKTYFSINKLTVFKLFLGCAGIFLFLICLRYFIPSYNGNSAYFPIQETGTEVENNDRRIKTANDIIKGFDWNMLKEKPPLNLSISIIASERKNGFITQSLAFLISEVKSWERVPRISICNVEAQSFDEIRIFDTKIPIHSINNLKSSKEFDTSENDGRIKKETSDYWKCLEAAFNASDSDFVLLVEDDAVPIPYFGVLLESLFHQLSDKSLKGVDFVKLFHPWRLRKIPFIFQACAFSVALGITVTYMLFRRFPIYSIIIFSCLSYICLKQYSYCELFSDARFHFTSSAYITYPESCCTPGVLFRSSSIPRMLTYFKAQESGGGHAKDHILDESPFTGKGTDFNYFLHIGHFSSVRQKVIPLESLDKVL